MDIDEWPASDQAWARRYRLAMTGKHVPALSLVEREQDLLDAIREAGMPAAELFGDAKTLATEDAAELVTMDEMVRASMGGGPKPALREIAGTWVGIGAVAVLISDPDPGKAQRAMKAMMQMTKIDIAKLQEAVKG